MTIREIRESISQEDAHILTPIFTEAFGQPPTDSFLERLNEKRDLSVLIAEEEERIIGFKIGYTRYRGIFFSWLGGVDKSYLRQGVARDLLKEQHQLCLERGYEEIQTETSGTNRSMLILNLQEGFEVYGVHMGQDEVKVELRKFL